MAGTKEIRNQIASVKSTQKITKAMQMVATSKMRRAQERMKLARPYAEKIRHVIGNLLRDSYDQLFQSEEYRRIQRGLDGDETVDLACRTCEISRCDMRCRPLRCRYSAAA